ncbi:MAG: hypothetical protein EA357_01625 [Micavibrio sp.]|nr:MAG: hypothetical protein EA357_01625 [Micavibrio sp.]
MNIPFAEETGCIVEEILRATAETLILHCRPDTPRRFAAGQYALLHAPGMEAPRAYSLAGAEDDPLLSFHIKLMAGSPTTQAFAALRPGDRITADLPHGQSRLDKHAATPIAAIAGGVGIAPIHAVIRTARAARPERPVHLYWGCNRREELYLHEDYMRMAEAPHFRYTPVLLQPQESFAAGLVGENIDWEKLKSAAPDIFLAGPQNMMRHTLSLFKAHGIAPEKIHYDKFW